MTLSLTCLCGARLDIDEKFAGQTIHCPDCNRPLATAPPPPAPTTTSGLALASFTLALIGAFTVVGTLAAMVLGFLALMELRRSPGVGGRRFAKLGIALGAIFTIATLAVLWTGDLLRLDGFLRTVEWAGKLEYSTDDLILLDPGGAFDRGGSASIRRPTSAWARLIFRDPNTERDKSDDLVLVDLWEDAYIVCLTKWIEPGLTLENCRQEGQQRFFQSELLTKILSRTGSKSLPLAGQERERKQLPGTETQEFVIDLRLGGVDRTFLVRVLRDGTRLNIVAGGTRKSRFARLQPVLVNALDSYKMEK